jgi:hypothetical protein
MTIASACSGAVASDGPPIFQPHTERVKYKEGIVLEPRRKFLWRGIFEKLGNLPLSFEARNSLKVLYQGTKW